MDQTNNDEPRTPQTVDHDRPRHSGDEGGEHYHEERQGAVVASGHGKQLDRAGELFERWQRTAAELENLRKRCERQVTAARAGERDRVTGAWLPVLDHLELALTHAQADPASIVAGVTAVVEQARAVLTSLGYRRVDEVGARFDPSRHEAAQVVPDPGAEPNTVAAVLRAGYVTESGCLRPAVVTVAAAPQ